MESPDRRRAHLQPRGEAVVGKALRKAPTDFAKEMRIHPRVADDLLDDLARQVCVEPSCFSVRMSRNKTDPVKPYVPSRLPTQRRQFGNSAGRTRADTARHIAEVGKGDPPSERQHPIRPCVRYNWIGSPCTERGERNFRWDSKRSRARGTPIPPADLTPPPRGPIRRCLEIPDKILHPGRL